MAFVNNCALVPPIQSPVLIGTAAWSSAYAAAQGGWPPVAAAPLPFSPPVINPIYPPVPVPPLVPYIQDIYGYQGPPYECCKPRYNNWPYDHFSPCDRVYNNCGGLTAGCGRDHRDCGRDHRDKQDKHNSGYNRDNRNRHKRPLEVNNKSKMAGSDRNKNCELCDYYTKGLSKNDKIEALLRSFGKAPARAPAKAKHKAKHKVNKQS